MKTLATTLFGLFLVATSFSMVNPNQATPVQSQNIKTIATQVTAQKSDALVNQINKVMALTTKTELSGPIIVVQSCASACQDEL